MSETLYLVDDTRLAQTFRAARPKRLRTQESVREALGARGPSCWIASEAGELMKLIPPRPWPRADRRLLLLKRPPAAQLELLLSWFSEIIPKSRRFLPPEEMAEALNDPACQDLFLGVKPVPEGKVLIVYRGNLTRLLVPQTLFRRRPSGPEPDFTRARVIDGGQTLALGDYEAAADAILYELDAGFRRRARARAIAEDRGFGAALRRLRLQKGVARDDFPGLTARTIARLERGEVERPHPATLQKIARRLGVTPEAIETY